MSEPALDYPSNRRDSATRSRHLVVAGLLAALLASAAWLSFPLGTVPVTLQVFIVVLIALLLPPRWAAGAVGSYLLLGAVGAPVFAGGRGGFGVLFGPTGGYLFGFLIGATLGSMARLRLRKRFRDIIADSLATLLTVLVIYVVGWAQLAAVTNTTWLQAFAVGVAPFVAFDVVKAAIAIGVASALRRAGVVPA